MLQPPPSSDQSENGWRNLPRDVLAEGEAVPERAQAIARRIAERVRQAAGEWATRDEEERGE